jgi:hypothetical protein
MRIIAGSIIGLVVCPVAVVLLGFVLGGVGRAAPCHSAPDFFSGALFGAFASAYYFGLPALGVGAVVGAIVPAVLSRRGGRLVRRLGLQLLSFVINEKN